MLHTIRFPKIDLPVLEKKNLSGFYHIWAWRPSLSCVLYFAINLSFSLPMDASHKIPV